MHHIGLFDVLPSIGHCALSECGAKIGHRWSVSNPGLIVQDQHARAGTTFHVRKAVSLEGAEAASGAGPAVYGDSRGVSDDVIAILLHQGGDMVEGEVPRDLLKLVAVGGSILRVFQPGRRVDDIAPSPSGRACRGSPGGPDQPRCE
jgi:hypothetical protein